MTRTRFLLITVAAVLLAATATLGVLWHRDYRVYVVHTGSMLPAFRPGDVVVDRRTDAYSVGDAITFRTRAGDGVVTHRVYGVGPDGIRTKGDANTTPDTWTVAPSTVEGTVVHVVRRAGFVLVYLRQPAGIGSLLTLVTTILLAWRLFFPAAPAAPAAGGAVEAAAV